MRSIFIHFFVFLLKIECITFWEVFLGIDSKLSFLSCQSVFGKSSERFVEGGIKFGSVCSPCSSGSEIGFGGDMNLTGLLADFKRGGFGQSGERTGEMIIVGLVRLCVCFELTV